MAKGSRAPLAERPAGRRRKMPDEVKRQIAGVLLVGMGVWLYLGLFGAAVGRTGEWMAGVLAVLAGSGRWLLPAVVIWLGGAMAIGRGLVLGSRTWGAMALLGCFLAALHTPVAEREMWAWAVQGQGGGTLGGALAWGLTRLFGENGRFVALGAAAVAGVILLTEISLAAWVARLTTALGALPAALRRLGLRLAAALRGKNGAPPAGRSAGRTRAAAQEGALAGRTGADAARAVDAERPPWELNDTPPVIHIAQLNAAQAAAAGPGALADPAAVAAGGAGEGKERRQRTEGAEPPAPPERQRAGREPRTAPHGGGGAGGGTVSGAHAQGAGPDDYPGYQLPPLTLLRPGKGVDGDGLHRDIMERARLLEHTLETFGVRAKVIEVHQGPSITRFELQPAPGVKVARITSLADDLALNLAATGVRIEAPIPGKAAIGIEVPNKEILPVALRDVLETPEFQGHPSRLAIGLGKDLAGRPVLGSLERMPHLLIAGATGSGKSTCINAILCSLLFKARPDEVKLLLIDPKMVELQGYNGLPHLTAPVVTDPRKAAGYLKWAVREMEQRYELFARTGVRDVARYNEYIREDGPKDENGTPILPLPYIVVVIDELADLMMVASVEVEDAICRLAQMARAAGIHLVVATQRPSVDVITGLIKANIPSRIAFAVSSQVDSRTILDMGGAEKLLGKGDMLYNPVGAGKPVRAQGAFIAEQEVERLVSFVRNQGRPEFQAEALELEQAQKNGSHDPDEMDPLLGQAVRVVIEHGQASVSILQRRLRVNYTRAARLVDDMEKRGWIGPHQGPKPRDVLIGMDLHTQIFGREPE